MSVSDADRDDARAEVREAAEALPERETARLQAELRRLLQEEQRARQRLDAVLAALDAGILIVDAQGRVESANRAAAVLTGCENLVGRPAPTCVGEANVAAPAPERAEGEAEANAPFRVIRRALSGEPESSVLLLDPRPGIPAAQGERALLARLAELLAGLSRLTHQINNPLTSLLGRAQILRMRADIDPGVRKGIDVIEDSAKRIAGHVREIAVAVHAGRDDLRRSTPAGGAGRRSSEPEG